MAAFTFLFLSFSYAEEAPLSTNYQSISKPNNTIIVNDQNKSKRLTLNQARAIFSLRVRRWPDGSKIKVIVLRDKDPIHTGFLKNTLKILPHQLRRNWDRYIYSGTGQGPVIANDVQEMMYMVSRIPGAIGYIEKGASHETVHTLSIL